jgi:hypothetical protein
MKIVRRDRDIPRRNSRAKGSVQVHLKEVVYIDNTTSSSNELLNSDSLVFVLKKLASYHDEDEKVSKVNFAWQFSNDSTDFNKKRRK